MMNTEFPCALTPMHAFISLQKTFIVATLLTFLAGCQVVNVKQEKLNVILANERESILSRNKLSEASLNVLTMTGREAKACTEQPQQCVDELRDIPQILDEQLYSTASEIFLAKALELKTSSQCAPGLLQSTLSEDKKQAQLIAQHKCLEQQIHWVDKSLRYSYAYLFKTQRQPESRLFDNRQVQVRDFYNQAIALLISGYDARYQDKKLKRSLKVGDTEYHLDFSQHPELATDNLEKLISSYNLNFSGLRSINRRDGFGSEFVAVYLKPETHTNHTYIIDPLRFSYPNGQNPNIHQARYLATTITAQPRQTPKNVDDIINTKAFSLKMHNPYLQQKVAIANKEYSLAANFSAPYGLWLAENNLASSAYLSLIDRDQTLLMPHVYMLEPYNPNKKILVMVHGLASSPEAWIALTNDIMGDTILRENYQVWQVFYSTNMPIIESRFQIYALLTQAFQQVPRQDTAQQDAVLIGHSMGGIIARLLVSEADLTQQANNLMRKRDQNHFGDRQDIMQRFELKPIPQFSRAIFLAAPHQGTEYAERWFTLAARKIIRLPGAFLSSLNDALINGMSGEPLDQGMKKGWERNLIQNGPSDLSHKSNFIELTKDVQVKPNVLYHSIIGNATQSKDPQIITDGIVPYYSAHLDGAVSEKILPGGHSIQETPEAVLELRRILRLHLKELGQTQTLKE